MPGPRRSLVMRHMYGSLVTALRPPDRRRSSVHRCAAARIDRTNQDESRKRRGPDCNARGRSLALDLLHNTLTFACRRLRVPPTHHSTSVLRAQTDRRGRSMRRFARPGLMVVLAALLMALTVPMAHAAQPTMQRFFVDNQYDAELSAQ